MAATAGTRLKLALRHAARSRTDAWWHAPPALADVAVTQIELARLWESTDEAAPSR